LEAVSSRNHEKLFEIRLTLDVVVELGVVVCLLENEAV